MKNIFAYKTPLAVLMIGISMTAIAAHSAPQTHKIASPITVQAKNANENQSATVADPEPVTAPGVDILPMAQYKQAKADANNGQKALAEGDLAAAEADFRSSVTLDGTNNEGLVGLAQTLEQEGKNSEAISVYRYLLYPKKDWGTSSESDPILRMHYALLLAGDNQWPEAVFVYEKTIDLIGFGPTLPALGVHFDPTVPDVNLFQTTVHLALGIAYTNKGIGYTDNRYQNKAIAQYKMALSEAPDSALANFYYGYGLQTMGHRADAKAAFQKAADLDQGGDIKAAAVEAVKRLGG